MTRHSTLRGHHFVVMTKRWILWGLASLVVTLALPGVAPTGAQSPHRVGLIVAHDGKVITKCIEFSEEQISGYDVLERSGLALIPMVSSSMGVAICSIDNRGCNYPAESCFCKCQGTPCIYWSYWHLVNGEWQYSSLGASNHYVRHGDVEGWVWGEGEFGITAQKPPSVRFEDICGAQPPAAPPAEPNPSQGEATSAEPTLSKKKLPVIDYFTADRTTIFAGESVTLSWDLHGAKEAYLRVGDQEQGVVAPYSMVVAPQTTTEYVLLARNKHGEVKKKLTIEVIPATPTPSPTATPTPTETPRPAPTPAPTDTPLPPTATPTPRLAEAVLSPRPSPMQVYAAPPPISRLPTITPTLTRTPTSTWTPALLAAVRSTPMLLRVTPQVLGRTQSLPGITGSSMEWLVLLGVLSIVGGLAALVLIWQVWRQTASRRPGTSLVRRDVSTRHETRRRK
ncbi:MAG: hypothetical protein NZ765_05060 [Anaerolineae bacterium]|nr:hypothetical protein [Anaerolineae bacterium]MDW8070976.1 hypothetical protein [Anaerolineae bacterium]